MNQAKAILTHLAHINIQSLGLCKYEKMLADAKTSIQQIRHQMPQSGFMFTPLLSPAHAAKKKIAELPGPHKDMQQVDIFILAAGDIEGGNTCKCCYSEELWRLIREFRSELVL